MRETGVRSLRVIFALFLYVWTASSPCVYAQWELDPVSQAYFITGDFTFTSVVDPNGDSFNFHNILVGKNNRTDFETLPGTVTVTLTQGFSIFQDSGGHFYPDGHEYRGVHVFGQHKINVVDVSPEDSYPYIWEMSLHDNSVVNMSGGLVEQSVNVNDSASFAASNGASMRFLKAYGTSSISFDSSAARVYLSDSAQGTFSNSNLGELVLSGSAHATTSANVNIGFQLSAADNSVAEIPSGNIDVVVASGASLIKLGVATSSFLLECSGNSTVELSGSIPQGQLKDNSTLIIKSSGNMQFLTVNDAANVVVDGGVLFNFASLVEGTVTLNSGALEGYAYLRRDSVLNLRGGNIEDVDLFNLGNSSVYNFFGHSLEFTNPVAGHDVGYGGDGVFYDLAWVRPDGILQETSFFDGNGDVANAIPPGVTFTLVPEPSSDCLLIAGILVFCLRSRRRSLL